MTSWPALIMRSAFSIARCRKSFADNAAFPRKSGSRSSTTPLPIWVLKNGMLVLSINRRNIFDVNFRFEPAPINNSGCLAFSIISTACLIDLSSAIGRRTRLLGMICELLSSTEMSSGNSRWPAPGRSSSMIRKTSRTRDGMLSPLTIWVVYFVNGRIISTISRIWKCPCLLLLIGFCPVIMSMGMAPSWA